MTPGIYTLASGGVAAQARLDAVAQNLANVGTAGYKAERIVFGVEPLLNQPPVALDPIAREVVPLVVGIDQRRDFTQGPIVQTGGPLDVAVTGDGFFAVTTSRGERYTRQGSFALDAEGYLVTLQGDRVQGDGGDIRLGDGRIDIADDGSIRLDDAPTGRLRLVSFGPEPRLVPEGGALWKAEGAAGTTIDAAQVSVQQGALEHANVDAVEGLVELIEVSRGYEAYTRAITRLDEIAQKAINEVGRIG